jgi:hypothetical protein
VRRLGRVDIARGLCSTLRSVEGTITFARRSFLAGLVAFVVFEAIVPATSSARGELTQKPGKAGCISEDRYAVTCQPGRALGGVGVAVSPGVYVAGDISLAILDRDTTGALAQKPGKAGCVSEYRPRGDCQDGRAVVRGAGVAVSPDGKSVYVSSQFLTAGAVAIFDRATAPPSVSVRVRRTQPVGRTVAVLVLCRERCRVRVRGSLSVPPVRAQAARRFRLRSVTRRIPAVRRVTIRLRVPKRVRRAVTRALRNPATRSQVRARLSIRVSDSAGNARTVRRTVRISR